MRSKIIVIPFLVVALGANLSWAQYVFPKEGQSPEQQQRDDYQCHQWAVQQSGYDPTRPPPPPQAAPVDTGAEVSKGVVKGGLLGAGIGAIAGDAGKGAAAGAIFGGLRGGVQADRQKTAQASQQAAYSAGGSEQYMRAKAACLEGRGYVVK
jgi:hypothetical protein